MPDEATAERTRGDGMLHRWTGRLTAAQGNLSAMLLLLLQ